MKVAVVYVPEKHPEFQKDRNYPDAKFNIRAIFDNPDNASNFANERNMYIEPVGRMMINNFYKMLEEKAA
jgi:hypothetical protein